MCPNLAYLRGRSREHKLVNKLKAEGYVACRSAGSHSKWDVWSYHPEKRIVELFQLKSKKGGRIETKKLLSTDYVNLKTWWVTYDV